MLPGVLMSSYERYKHDTAVVSSWLVHTAQEYGYKQPLSPVKSNKSRAPPGKGHRGPQASRAGADNVIQGRVDKTHLAKREYAYVLAIKDFVPLAEFILAAKQRRNSQFPIYVAQALNRVIRSRKSFSTVLKTEASNGAADFRPSAAEDGKHSYFVRILEQVRKIFTPLLDKLDVADLEEALPGDAGASGNPFDALLVYDPSEEFQRIPDAARAAPTDTSARTFKAKAKAAAAAERESGLPAPDYMVESSDTFEDAVIAFYALMQDATALRERVDEMWHMYAQGALDLAAVSVATNTATSLVRQMEEDITPLLRKHGGILKFLHVYFIGIIKKMGLDYHGRERAGDDMNLLAYGAGDHCFFNVFQWLDGFRRAYSPEYFQPYNGSFGYFDSGLDRLRLTNRQKYAQDKAAIAELLGEVSIVAMVLTGVECEDELVAGVRLMALGITQDETPLWVTFAAQACLDAARILSDNQAPVVPMDEMLAWNKIMSSSIDEAMAYHRERKLRVANWAVQNDANLRQISKIATFWDSDPVRELKVKYGIRQSPRQAFLNRNPVFCGLWMHYVRANYHEAGTLFTSAWGSIVYLGQLYFAMHNEKVLPESVDWYDMRLVRMLQGNRGFFVGKPPKNADAHFKNYGLFMGYSAANWVPPSRRNRSSSNGAIVSAAGPRSFKTQGAVTLITMAHLAGERSQKGRGGGLTTEDVEKILEASEWSMVDKGGGQLILDHVTPEEDAAEDGAPGDDVPEDDDAPEDGTADTPATDSIAGTPKKKNKKNKKKKKNSKSKRARTATPSDFVFQLAMAVQAEVPEVSFNYFRMHRYCWAMLENIDAHLGPRLKELFDDNYLDNQTQLPFLVGYIFMVSSRTEIWPGVDRLELMRLAANALQESLPLSNGFMKEILTLSNINVQM